jgi:tRNA threonylcarbamoyladenosine modification (KEOPS) complex  Pcc1 subunit
MATDPIKIVLDNAHTRNVARCIQQNLALRHEDLEPEQEKIQMYRDKQTAARVASLITGFGA